MKPLKSQRKITHLTNEEIIYNFCVKTGRLQIDSQGRVWRNSKMGKNRAEVISKRNDRRRNSVQCVVREEINGRIVSCAVPRLIWLHTRGRIPHLQVVTSRDGNKANTNPKNLILCTLRESILYGFKRAA